MSKKWLIGITDFVQPPADIEQSAFPEAEFCFLKDWHLAEDNKQQWQKVDGLLVWNFKVDKDTAALLDNCKIVVRYGVGFDKIDIAALKERNIVFCNTPCSTTEVADTACAMILSLQRKINQYDCLCRHQDQWQQILEPIERTNQRVLGIIGAGRIGSAVIKRMIPFGLRILAYDPYYKGTIDGFELMSDIADFQSQCDIISLHCPLTDETRGMIDSEFISKMKKGSCLVNTARGGVLKSLDCLEEALRSGQLASAAMDVLPDEPPKAHPLLDAWRNDEDWIKGRLIITPHVADYSQRCWHDIDYVSAETIRLYLVNDKLRNQVDVNPWKK